VASPVNGTLESTLKQPTASYFATSPTFDFLVARRQGESARMEVLDATSLAERLKWEAKEYWLHLEADTPLEKYPGKGTKYEHFQLLLTLFQRSNMQDACKRSSVLRWA
jgi:hypothetical protein